MKILISDPISKSAEKALLDLGFDLDMKTEKKSPEELAEIIGEYAAVVVRSATKVRKAAIDKGENLKLIVRGGVGLDNIDVAYAESKGIEVRNTPAAASDSVAELALAHMFALARFIPQANITMRKGEWNKKAYKGTEIAGKTLGIIGIGRIGQALAKKAHALGMKIIAFDKFIKESPADYIEMMPVDDLFCNADIISLHIPFIKEEGAFIKKLELEKMKKGVTLINCARGGVVDEAALLEALNSGQVGAAGIDVFEEEPTKNNDLINHPNVSVSPHIGATTKEGQDRVGDEIAAIMKEFFNK